MTKLLILFISFWSVNLFHSPSPARPKTILAILAHPDDEMAIAEVLVKYRKHGTEVFLMIATDGKYGTRVTNIPEGDSLAAVRKRETTCACEKMGIEPPIFLSIDRLDTKNGVRNYFNAHKQLRELLIQQIASINPDIIITFGPDGDTHHAEHIVIGGAVTEVILQKGWVEKYPLYYVAYDRTTPGLEAVGFVDQQYINVEITYSQEEELIGLEANKCYASQITQEELKEDYERKIEDTINKSYFRKLAIKKGRQSDFE